MTFHADFWVVVGTASPVITLAAVVSATDSLATHTVTALAGRGRRQKRYKAEGAMVPAAASRL